MFIFDGSKLQDAAAKLLKIVGGAEIINIDVHTDNRVVLSAETSSETAKQYATATFLADNVKSSNKFAVNTSTFLKIIGNKKDVQGSIKDNQFHYKSGKTHGYLNTIEHKEIKIFKSKNAVSLSSQEKTAILDAIKAVQLHALISTDDIPFHIQLGKKTLEALCVTKWHAAHYKKKIKQKTDFVLQFPLEQSSTFKQFLASSGGTLKIHTKNNVINLWNDEIATSFPQYKNDSITGYKTELESIENKKPLFVTKFHFEDLANALASFEGYYEEDCRVSLSFDKKAFLAAIETTHGKGSSEIACNNLDGKPQNVNFELYTLSDIVSRLGDGETLSLYTGSGKFESKTKDMTLTYWVSTIRD